MSLVDLFRLLKRRWLVVLLVPLLFGCGAAAYAWLVLPDQYTSSVNMYVITKTVNAENGEESLNMSLSQQIANDISVLIGSDRVASATASSLGLESLEDFEVEVDSSSSNRVVAMKVTGLNPESVAQVANKLAEETAEVAVESLDLEAVNVIEEAKVSSAPSGPNRLKLVAVAILGGLCLAVIGVVARNALDTTVKSAEEAEEIFGYPILGNMPNVGKEA